VLVNFAYNIVVKDVSAGNKAGKLALIAVESPELKLSL